MIGWLRGIRDSRVLASAHERDLDQDAPFLRTPDGETPAMLRFSGDALRAIGFRHDLPDKEGRVWRTEGVLSHALAGPTRLLRIRGQCIAASGVARLEPPRRPHIVRAILERGAGGRDGQLAVQTAPHRLSSDDDGSLLAAEIIAGRASQRLPVIYVSAPGQGRWIVEETVLDRLALDLAGVAHVALEPSRDLSFRVRDLTDGRNPYGGTVGIALPEIGIVRRLFIGWALPDAEALIHAVKALVLDLRTDMARQGGLDWLDLQEAVLREQRRRDRSRLSAEETERLWQEELSGKDERIAELEQQLAEMGRQKATNPAGELGGSRVPSALGRELYAGEVMDRLCAALSDIVARGADQGWDSRSLALFQAALRSFPPAPGLQDLREDLRRATQDPARIGTELPAMLARLGYTRKSDNKHIRMEPPEGLLGAHPVTVPKTPGDHRSGENLRAQIERDLGLKRLSQRS